MYFPLTAKEKSNVFIVFYGYPNLILLQKRAACFNGLIFNKVTFEN